MPNTFPEHDLKTGFLGISLVGGDANAVGAVFVNEAT